MIYNVYSVYDDKAEAYMMPIFLKTHGIALRSFATTVMTEGHDFNKFREDYTLFYLGKFDDANASFDLNPTPSALIKANEVQMPERDDETTS